MIERGTIISGRYEIIKPLGEGGMGAVYEARHIHVGRKVAVKVLSKDLSQDRDALQRFQREAQIAGSIGHMNICEVMDFGIAADGTLFIVMELLEGYSLAEILALEKRLSIDHAFKLMLQVLEGLEEAHSKGIIHRDLKPENIFITNVKGHGELVKLLDFGISKIMKKGPESMRLTKTGALIGTPYYMSPEQVRGKKDIDVRCDIYACGVILFEMLTGNVPYGGETFNEIMAKILEEEVPDPRTARTELPTTAAALIRRCMDKNPSIRPVSAEEMKHEIEILLGELKEGRITGAALGTAADPTFGTITDASLERIRTETASVIGPEITRQGRKGKLIAVSVGITVLTIAALLVVIFLGFESIRRDGTSAGSQARVAKVVSMNAVPATLTKAAMQIERTAGAAPKVKIIMDGAPAGALIKVDDEVFKGNMAEVKIGSENKIFKVVAPGYESKEIAVIPDGDKIIDIKLRKLEDLAETENEEAKEKGAKAKEKKKINKPAEKAAVPAKETQKTKEEKEKKEKPDLKWNYPGA